VQGHFARLQGSTFATSFVLDTGQRYSAAGTTPAIEAQMEVLAAQAPPAKVKIWGTRNFDPKSEAVADLVITEILPEGDAELPAPAPASLPTAVVNFGTINLYNTPSQSMAVVGQARLGEQCTVQGRDPPGAWLLLDCGNVEGWADRRLVNVSGDLSDAPIVTSTVEPSPPTGGQAPTPAPTTVAPPASFRGWKASYFNNATLQGNPVFYEDAPNVDFNWAYGSPNGAVPVDYFSARYERTIDLAPGYYRLNALADDGIRVWVDDELVIDEWHGATGSQYTAIRQFSGAHRFRIELLELGGIASVRFDSDYSTEPPAWMAYYYNGAPSRGPYLYSQAEMGGGSIQLQRNWNVASPAPNRVPADLWNGRWQGQFNLDNGNYIFHAATDDGVRVYIDQTVVIDAWYDGPLDRSNSFKGIGAGKHTVTVDYYKRYGAAYLQVWWHRDTSGPSPSQ